MSKLTYVIRSCPESMTTHSNFVWPKSGPVECPDWDSAPNCGNGLHGLAWGIGDWSLCHLADPKAVWLVVAVESDSVVEIGGKVKFPRGEVIYCGSLVGAQTMITGKRLIHLADKAAGLAAPASTSGYAAPASTSGDAAPASTSGYAAPASTSGTRAPASTSGTRAPASTSGYAAPAVCLGYGGAAKCGPNGSVILTFHDGNRPRHVVGYAGEDGIEADKWYRASAGKLQLCPDQNNPI